MKGAWLNLLLKITNKIYTNKELAYKQEGPKIVLVIGRIIFYEIAHLIVALPLYFVIKTTKVVAFLEDKGSYKRVAADFKIRKILTLTGVGVILVLWIFKYMFVAWSPQITGQVSLYSVSDITPVSLEEEFKFEEVLDTQANISSELPVPKILSAEKDARGVYRFSGIGIPGAKVFVFLTADQSVVYKGDVDVDGKWEVEHVQKEARLKSGRHIVFAYQFFPEEQIRSMTSGSHFFEIEESFTEKIFQKFDLYLNNTIILIILGGIFLLILTI